MFTDDIVPYIENPIDTIIKLLQLINEFSKVVEYKINTQKSVTFLYIDKKLSEMSQREIKETIPFTITSKSIRKQF